MDGNYAYMVFLAFLFNLFALIYTIRAARAQALAKGERDSEIPKIVRERPYLKNPVFLSYVLFASATLLLIFFLLFRFGSY